MEREKHVDESWKEKASQDKGEEVLADQTKAPEAEASEEAGNFDLNFVSYITSLGFQAMIFLGVIPNPITNETQKNLNQAKLIIDTLLMLREKTKNNLTKEEGDLLNSSIYELQVNFIEVSQGEIKKN